MMSELVLETEYLFLTVASVATLLAVIFSWRVLSKKQIPKNKKDDQVTGKQSDEDLLINSADIGRLDSKDIQKLQEGAGDSPSHFGDDANVQRVRVDELEKEVAKEMTKDQLDEEKRVREEQLSAIFKLMQDNQDRFGVDSVEDVKSQYKMYAS